MIDYDTFESIMGSKEAIYSATILASATAGYLLGRTLSKRKTRLAEIEQEKSVVHANIRQSELEAEAEKSRVSLEIKRLDYENADSRHQRMLEIIDK